MFEENVIEVLRRVDDSAIVLDIGGWARPFNRANYVIDAEPYATRGCFSNPENAKALGWYAPAQGGKRERFTRETWIQRDICEKMSFPFRDKEIDFVICSHTLEDLRDPLWVCAEMIRVAKRGYIEVPSRLAESSRGVEPNQVGWSHHRWLVDIAENHVSFTMKYHMMHSHWRFSYPANKHRALSDRAQVQWLFWEGGFSVSEVTIHGTDAIAKHLEDFIRKNDGYPDWLLAVDRQLRRASGLLNRASSKFRRMIHPRPVRKPSPTAMPPSADGTPK